MGAVTNWRQILVSCVGMAILGGCEAQRTVLHTESRMGFGDSWAEQIGDEKKMKEKYASGFEIKDGRAVATGSKQNPFEKKEFATGDFAAAESGMSKKGLAKKEFRSNNKTFATGDYVTGSPAQESGRRAFWQSKEASGIDGEFATAEWAQAARAFDSGQAAREQGNRFSLPGRKREAGISERADRVEIDSSNSQPIVEGSFGSTLSVDDVRKMLSPEAFR